MVPPLKGHCECTEDAFKMPNSTVNTIYCIQVYIYFLVFF